MVAAVNSGGGGGGGGNGGASGPFSVKRGVVATFRKPRACLVSWTPKTRASMVWLV
jgi:hypothetical protein